MEQRLENRPIRASSEMGLFSLSFCLACPVLDHATSPPTYTYHRGEHAGGGAGGGGPHGRTDTVALTGGLERPPLRLPGRPFSKNQSASCLVMTRPPAPPYHKLTRTLQPLHTRTVHTGARELGGRTNEQDAPLSISQSEQPTGLPASRARSPQQVKHSTTMSATSPVKSPSSPASLPQIPSLAKYKLGKFLN